MTNGLFRHATSSIIFALTVDDFGVQFTDKAHVDHFIALLKQHYKITVDWEGKNCCGLDLEWDYDEGFMLLSFFGCSSRSTLGG